MCKEEEHSLKSANREEINSKNIKTKKTKIWKKK